MWGLLLTAVVLSVATGKQAGFVFIDKEFGHPNDYPVWGSKAALKSLDQMQQTTAANWIALTPVWSIFSIDSPGPLYPNANTATDDMIHTMINQAHQKGMKVKIRPAINPDFNNTANKGLWRGEIGRYFNSTQWDTFFRHYIPFISHYAKLAAKFNADQLAVGVELVNCALQSKHWAPVVAEVRSLYSGPISYDSNHGNENNVTWWHLVDKIGVDAYYPLAPTIKNPTVSQLKAAWQVHYKSLSALSLKYGKQVHFSEIGYCAVNNNNHNPAKCNSQEHNNTAQIVAFEAALDTFWNAEFFEGIFPWCWFDNVTAPSGGPNASGMGLQSKPKIAALFHKYYATAR